MHSEGVCGDKASLQPLLQCDDRDSVAQTAPSLQVGKEARDGPMKVALTFKDITYTLSDRKRGKKNVLRGISGYVRSGELLAILGPSGAGKSTLLDILAQCPKSGEVGGKILLNGRDVDYGSFRRISAYVQQEDLLRSYLTVRETIFFAAQLRTPPFLTNEELRLRTERIMRLLGIDGVGDVKIGSELVRGISGGERKRCTVAVELVASPSLIFLDEPTTGLDTFTALHLLTVLRDVARTGVAVVFSIHQPRSSIFRLFDQLLLLSDCGEEAYFGPARSAVPFFARIGIASSFPDNPADFLLDAVAVPPADDLLDGDALEERYEISCAPSGPFIAATFRNVLLEEVKQDIDTINDFWQRSSVDSFTAAEMSPYFRSVWVQIRVVATRAVINTLRDPIATQVSVVAAIFFAVLIGSVYFRLGLQQPSIRDRMGALFFVLMNTAFSNLGSLNLLMTERAIFIQEHRNGMYRAVAHLVGKIVQDVPLNVLKNLVFNTIVYFMVGLQVRADKFFLFFFICTLVMLNSYALCLFISNLSRDMQVANIVAPLVFVVYLLPSGGVLMSADSLPFIWRWIKYVSFVRYGLAGLVVNEFDGLTFNCTADDVVCVRDGTTYAELQGFHVKDLWGYIGTSAGSVVVYLVLAYISLFFLRTRGNM